MLEHRKILGDLDLPDLTEPCQAARVDRHRPTIEKDNEKSDVRSSSQRLGGVASAPTAERLRVWRRRSQRPDVSQHETGIFPFHERTLSEGRLMSCEEEEDDLLTLQVSEPVAPPSQEVSVLSWTLSAETPKEREETAQWFPVNAPPSLATPELNSAAQDVRWMRQATSTNRAQSPESNFVTAKQLMSPSSSPAMSPSWEQEEDATVAWLQRCDQMQLNEDFDLTSIPDEAVSVDRLSCLLPVDRKEPAFAKHPSTAATTTSLRSGPMPPRTVLVAHNSIQSQPQYNSSEIIFGRDKDSQRMLSLDVSSPRRFSWGLFTKPPKSSRALRSSSLTPSAGDLTERQHSDRRRHRTDSRPRRRHEELLSDETATEGLSSAQPTEKLMKELLRRLTEKDSSETCSISPRPAKARSAEVVCKRKSALVCESIGNDDESISGAAQWHSQGPPTSHYGTLSELMDHTTTQTGSQCVINSRTSQNEPAAELESYVRGIWHEADAQVCAAFEERDAAMREAETERKRLVKNIGLLQATLDQRDQDLTRWSEERRRLKEKSEELEEMLSKWERSFDRLKAHATDRENVLSSEARQLRDLLAQRDADLTRANSENIKRTHEMAELEAQLHENKQALKRQLADLTAANDEALRSLRMKHEDELNLLEAQWKPAMFNMRQLLTESRAQNEALSHELQNFRSDANRSAAELAKIQSEAAADRARLEDIISREREEVSKREKEIEKLKSDCEDLALSCKKTKKAYDTLRKNHVPSEDFEALRERNEEANETLGELKSVLTVANDERDDLRAQLSRATSECGKLEKSLMERDVNLTVKTKMLEEQSSYVASMRGKIQALEKEILELTSTLRKREDQIVKLSEENKALKDAMPPPETAQAWQDLKARQESLRREIADKENAFDLVLKKLDELEQERDREKAAQAAEAKSQVEAIEKRLAKTLDEAQESHKVTTKMMRADIERLEADNSKLVTDLHTASQELAATADELQNVKRAAGEKLAQLVDALTNSARRSS